MEPDSESRTIPKTPIPYVLPATHAISVSNTESPLLRLPQELKNRIYHLVYGGIVIRVFHDTHLDSLDMRAFDDTHFVRRQSGVLMASLRTCRQIYHDAKDAFYSANMFLVGRPKPLDMFLRHLDCVSHRALVVQNMDLRVVICSRHEELEWDNGFCALAEDLKNVRHISIYIYLDEGSRYRVYPLEESLTYRKEPFLPGLLEWKKLPLKTFTLLVKGLLEEIVEEEKWYIWTAVQKREWVQYAKGAVMGLD